MSEIQRVKKVCKWLIYSEYAENDKELAEKLGYTKSSLSQILNGKVPISNKFIDKLCEVDKNINKVWILSATGEMFIKDISIGSGDYYKDLSDSRKDVIDLQREKIESLQKKINVLIKEQEKSHYSGALGDSISTYTVELDLKEEE